MATNVRTQMAKSDDAADEAREDESLPDEREAIAERLESLADDERLSVADVAAALDIDLDE